jgi:hypothetical protein
MRLPGQKPKVTVVRTTQPRLPGPWQYLSLLPMLQVARGLTRDLPRGAYPIVALVVWRTLKNEQRKQEQALLDARRTAIRRSLPVYVVKPAKKKRFLLF